MLTFFGSFFAGNAVASAVATTAVNNVAVSAIENVIASSAIETDDPAQAIAQEMNRRSTNFAYGIGRLIGKLLGTVKDEPESVYVPEYSRDKKAQKRQQPFRQVNTTQPMSEVYQSLFPQDTIRLLYLGEDMGVDDAAALLQVLAAKSKQVITNSKKIELIAIVPCTGNAVLTQTQENTLKILELTNNQAIPVYPGAIAPLAIQNNQTAINEMEKGTNTTHFYGHDGLEDVGEWPAVNIKMQTIQGFQFAADTIFAASIHKPLTLVSTSSLTELAKTLTELIRLDKAHELTEGSFAKKISAISMMGGCINPTVGCNAPFNVPDNQKNSEANFYFDTPAAQIVFSTCQKYGIPILLAPLDITQQPGLLWTKAQVKALYETNNPVAKQMARVTDVVPYLDVPCFPNGTYPMHDLHATADFIFPHLYDVTKVAITIGDVGQTQINENASDAQKNVYVLSMNLANQEKFYQAVLEAYRNFDKPFFGKKEVLFLFVPAGLFLSGAAICCGIKRCRKKATHHLPVMNDEENALTQDETLVASEEDHSLENGLNLKPI
ncbi:MAG: nucleoside hydrolase [Gammaproteobacteria bacterium]|jgi:inosine-uridine nucleoside N-ribohydrolase|nr:nucleoside hydrolase [Gammaproteobacteria bacterium]